MSRRNPDRNPSSRVVRKRLRKAGCVEKRQRGSHLSVSCPPDKTGIVPVHGSRDIPIGTLRSIERQTGVHLRNPAKGLADLPPNTFIERTDYGNGTNRFTFVGPDGKTPRGDARGWLLTVPVDLRGKYTETPAAYMIGTVSATHGWGPFLYDIAMETAGTAGLFADRREVSLDALRVWQQYARRADVTQRPLPADTPRPAIFDYDAYYHVRLPKHKTKALMSRYSKKPTTLRALKKAGRLRTVQGGDRYKVASNPRRRNPQDLGSRSQRVIDHLVSRCGMSRSEAIEAVGKQKGEGSDRPALTPEGLELYERAVKRMDIRVPPYRAIFLLLPRTGLRIGEMVTLTWDRLDRQRGVWLVVGKNSDLREIPVTKDAWRILDEYERDYDPKSKGDGHWVFPRMRGPDHVSTSRAGGAMRALRHEEPKLSDLTPHVLRHTFATEKLRECMPPAKLRDLLGHAGTRTAMLYYHL